MSPKKREPHSFNRKAHDWEHAGAPAARVPAGSIIMYGGDTAPRGWLLCNGATIKRGTYSKLFQAIGETYGAGDGSTTFKIPDLRSRFPVGAGTYETLGGDEGDTEANRTPHHSHQAGTLGTSANSTSVNRTATGSATAADGHTHGVNGSTTENLGGTFPRLGVNFIIKT